MINQLSDVPTLQVGTLELRKTDEGWQYLSEGLHGEPDRWCDAATALGPFSNLGVSILLDELLGARELTTLRGESVCRNCRYWTSKGYCDFIDTIQGERVADTTGCQIIATVHDDYGLATVLKTAPNFSCPSFQA
jgi:hypothetical protein